MHAREPRVADSSAGATSKAELVETPVSADVEMALCRYQCLKMMKAGQCGTAHAEDRLPGIAPKAMKLVVALGARIHTIGFEYPSVVVTIGEPALAKTRTRPSSWWAVSRRLFSKPLARDLDQGSSSRRLGRQQRYCRLRDRQQERCGWNCSKLLLRPIGRQFRQGSLY